MPPSQYCTKISLASSLEIISPPFHEQDSLLAGHTHGSNSDWWDRGQNHDVPETMQMDCALRYQFREPEDHGAILSTHLAESHGLNPSRPCEGQTIYSLYI